MHTDREIAATLIDKCYRRMSGKEIALCHYVNQEGTLLPGDVPMFASLKTQFAADLDAVVPVHSIETPDEEGAGLL